MLAAIHCVIFKQADCHILTMKQFLARDVKTLSEEGPDVRVFIYSHKRDKVLSLSKVRPWPSSLYRLVIGTQHDRLKASIV